MNTVRNKTVMGMWLFSCCMFCSCSGLLRAFYHPASKAYQILCNTGTFNVLIIYLESNSNRYPVQKCKVCKLKWKKKKKLFQTFSTKYTSLHS